MGIEDVARLAARVGASAARRAILAISTPCVLPCRAPPPSAATLALQVEALRKQARALEVAVQLAGMAQAAIRWTKHTLNHWYRQAGPIFDASLAYEMLGFGGPDAREGLMSHQEKRAPHFSGPTSE